MKICVIGKGTSSILTTLKLIQHGHSVVVYSDPNIPHILVGESTTPQVTNLLKDVAGITVSDLVDEQLASFKMGIEFVGWGNKKYFKHPFLNETAMHFTTKNFNDAVWSHLELKFGVEFIEEKVENYSIQNNEIEVNGKRYDFIIKCSGFSNENLKPTNFETVNSVVTFKKPSIENPNFTIHRATEDGWQFELPFPHENESHCGYLYNTKYTTKESVEKKIEYPITGSFSWKPQYSPVLLENAFAAVNGNACLFFEPLQALSLHYYVDFAQYICEFLKDRSEQNYYYTNNLYRNEVYSYEYSIAFHYSNGSKYQTKFWKEIKNKVDNFFTKTPNGDINNLIDNCICDSKYQTSYSRIGCFSNKDLKYLISGLYNYVFI